MNWGQEKPVTRMSQQSEVWQMTARQYPDVLAFDGDAAVFLHLFQAA